MDYSFACNFLQGTVERLQDKSTVIVRNLVKKETDISKFERLRVTLSTGELGFIEGSFGKSGKIKVRIPGELISRRLCNHPPVGILDDVG